MSRPRSRLASVLTAVALLLGGCSFGPSGQDDGVKAPPFVFRALDLRQQDMLGRATWSLTSPEARYDIRRRVAQADRPRGVIFRHGKAAFRLSAISGTVLNEGQVVLLEGRIRVEQLGEQPLLIRAERARWFPSQNRLDVDRRPEVLDASNRISSRHARFGFDTRQLTLRHNPQLEHWRQPSPPASDRDRGRPELVMTVREAQWNTGTGLLRTLGPVQARRHVPGRADAEPLQTLTATRLEGNTQQQLFWLRGPVQLRDPQDSTDLRSGDLRIDLQASQAISSGCRLQRSADALQADHCSWNWDTQNVEARGNVLLQRQAYDQSSRGGVLSGRLGPDGFLTLTHPGGRVISRLHLPQGRRPSLRPQLQRPRPTASPIRL